MITKNLQAKINLPLASNVWWIWLTFLLLQILLISSKRFRKSASYYGQVHSTELPVFSSNTHICVLKVYTCSVLSLRNRIFIKFLYIKHISKNFGQRFQKNLVILLALIWMSLALVALYFISLFRFESNDDNIFVRSSSKYLSLLLFEDFLTLNCNPTSTSPNCLEKVYKVARPSFRFLLISE